MKTKTNFILLLLLPMFLVLGSFKNDAANKKTAVSLRARPLVTKTQNFTVNGHTGTVTLQYTVGSVYLGLSPVPISGVGSVAMVSISHTSSGVTPVTYIDKWEGTIMGSDGTQYTIDVTITGNTSNWNIQSVTPSFIVA